MEQDLVYKVDLSDQYGTINGKFQEKSPFQIVGSKWSKTAVHLWTFVDHENGLRFVGGYVYKDEENQYLVAGLPSPIVQPGEEDYIAAKKDADDDFYMRKQAILVWAGQEELIMDFSKQSNVLDDPVFAYAKPRGPTRIATERKGLDVHPVGNALEDSFWKGITSLPKASIEALHPAIEALHLEADGFMLQEQQILNRLELLEDDIDDAIRASKHGRFEEEEVNEDAELAAALEMLAAEKQRQIELGHREPDETLQTTTTTEFNPDEQVDEALEEMNVSMSQPLFYATVRKHLIQLRDEYVKMHGRTTSSSKTPSRELIPGRNFPARSHSVGRATLFLSFLDIVVGEEFSDTIAKKIEGHMDYLDEMNDELLIELEQVMESLRLNQIKGVDTENWDVMRDWVKMHVLEIVHDHGRQTREEEEENHIIVEKPETTKLQEENEAKQKEQDWFDEESSIEDN